MKKSMLTFGCKSFILALSLSGLLLAGCSKDKNEDAPPVVPAIGVTNMITGTVIDAIGNSVEGVAVALSGPETKNGTTDGEGGFTFDGLTKSGEYTITFTKTGLFRTTTNVNIAPVGTVGVSTNVSIQLVKEGVAAEIPTTGGTISLPAEENPIVMPVDFVVPQGAIVSTQAITITPINHIATPKTANQAMPLMTLSCAPSGLEFNQPCEVKIANPLQGYTMTDLNLFLYDGSVWVKQEQPVSFQNGAYVTTISHFSDYQVAFDAAVNSRIPSTENLAAINSVDNLNGTKPIEVKTLPYSFKTGYEYVTSPQSVVAAAGITGTDAVKVTEILDQAVRSKLGGAAPGMKEVAATYPINVTVPVGVRLDAKGTQQFSTNTFTIKLEQDGRTIPLSVSAKIAGVASIETKAYNKKHEGGIGGN